MATPIGYEAWEGQAKLDAENDRTLAHQVQQVLDRTKWDSLRCVLSGMFQSDCTISNNFTYGRSGLVKLVRLADGRLVVLWLALGRDKIQKMMRRTWASHYIQQNTYYLNVTDVYVFNFSYTTAVGPPYLVMKYLHGNPASSFTLKPEEHARFLQQLAMQVTALYAQKLNAIGAIHQDASGKYSIGPEPETGMGPFKRASDYYKAVSKHRFEKYTKTFVNSNRAIANTPGMHLPLLFDYMMPKLSQDWDSEGPFGLVNVDTRLYDHTLLDDNLNFVGSIQPENIMPAPIHVVGQIASRYRITPPGLQTRDPMVRDNDRKGREAFYGYLAAIRKMERDFNEYDGFVTPMTDAMDSYGSHLFRGLNDYRRHDRRDNEEWVRSYWFMFYDESKEHQSVTPFSDVAPSPPAEKDETAQALVEHFPDLDLVDGEARTEAVAFALMDVQSSPTT